MNNTYYTLSRYCRVLEASSLHEKKSGQGRFGDIGLGLGLYFEWSTSASLVR